MNMRKMAQDASRTFETPFQTTEYLDEMRIRV